MTDTNEINTLDAVTRMAKDLRAAAKELSDDEARFLVDAYYQMQRNRIRSNNQVRAMSESGEPHNVLTWLGAQNGTLEKQIKTSLDVWSYNHPVGFWMRQHKGVGPVIAAGILSRIKMTDVKMADGTVGPVTTAGQIWRYAGLDPTSKWGKGQKRPWNAELKKLCWLLGESFVKVSGYEDAFYGKVYKERKAYETRKNEAGDYADQAAASLREKKFGEDTTARKYYEKGQLPPARIHLRSERYAVKLFLAHMFEVWFWTIHGELPPKPYVIAHLGHAHQIQVPKAPEGMPTSF